MSNGEGQKPKQPTIGDLLGRCHDTCKAIEERLCSIVASPAEEVSMAQGPSGEPTAVNLAAVLESDHADASGLSSRLQRIENHIALAQDRLKVLA